MGATQNVLTLLLKKFNRLISQSQWINLSSPQPMAIASGLRLLLLLLLLLLSTASASKLGDLLKKYGLPKGILPHAKHHSLSDDGDLTVELKKPCYIQFSDLVYYDRSITGALSYGALSDLSGVQVKKLFVWLPVSAIEVRPDSGTVDFKFAFLTLSYSADEFQKSRDCLDSSEESEFLPFSED